MRDRNKKILFCFSFVLEWVAVHGSWVGLPISPPMLHTFCKW